MLDAPARLERLCHGGGIERLSLLSNALAPDGALHLVVERREDAGELLVDELKPG